MFIISTVDNDDNYLLVSFSSLFVSIVLCVFVTLKNSLNLIISTVLFC